MISIKKQRGGCILRNADSTTAYVINTVVRADNGTPFLTKPVPVTYRTKALYERRAKAHARASQLRDDVAFVMHVDRTKGLDPVRKQVALNLIKEM